MRRVNLAGSTAHDLWAYGDRGFREQAEALAPLEAGDAEPATTSTARARLSRRREPGDSRPRWRKPAWPALDFADWIKAEAPKRERPVGRRQGQLRLVPEARPAQPLRLRPAGRAAPARARRSLASLRLEESAQPRGAADPPRSRSRRLRGDGARRNEQALQALVDAGFIADKPYFRSALFDQLGDYTPPDDRNFFTHVTALDPLPLSSHQFHWIELARLAMSRTRARSVASRRCSTSMRTARKASPRRWRRSRCRRASTTMSRTAANWCGSCSPTAPRAGSPRSASRPMRSGSARPASSTRPGPRAAGRTPTASWSGSSSCSTCASPATARAMSSARRRSIASLRSPRTKLNWRNAVLCAGHFRVHLGVGHRPTGDYRRRIPRAPALTARNLHFSASLT